MKNTTVKNKHSASATNLPIQV